MIDLNESRWPLHDDGLSLQEYGRVEEIPPSAMRQLEDRKGRTRLNAFLNGYFDRGARFWLAYSGNEMVGLLWTLVGGFDGFYSLPVSAKEAVVLAVEVFPEHRGAGYWPMMASKTFSRLKQDGLKRVYVKTHMNNKAMQASMKKLNCTIVGTVQSYSFLGRHITLWDKKGLWSGESPKQ